MEESGTIDCVPRVDCWDRGETLGLLNGFEIGSEDDKIGCCPRAISWPLLPKDCFSNVENLEEKSRLIELIL